MSSPRGISGAGRAELALALAGGRRVVTPDDVAAALAVDSVSAAKKLARWTDQGWLRRVRRGLYVPVPVDVADPRSWTEDPWVLADAVWTPCYFTGWTAANHWSLTEQMFRTIVLKTTGRVRRSNHRLLDHEYLVGHVGAENLTWGVSPVWRADRRLLVADPARAVVDSLDDLSLIGGARHGAEVVAAYLAEHSAGTLIEYGDRLGNSAVFKRLGYIAEHAHLDVDGLVSACVSRIASGMSMLDPTGPPTGERDSRWGLRINVTITGQDSS